MGFEVGVVGLLVGTGDANYIWVMYFKTNWTFPKAQAFRGKLQ